MPRSVRCDCGAYRELEIGPLGTVIEVCRCGVRLALRGRFPDDEPAKLHEGRPLTDRPCQWPDGCPGFTSAYNTDLCARHAQERRRAKDREYRRRIAANRNPLVRGAA